MTNNKIYFFLFILFLILFDFVNDKMKSWYDNLI